MHNFQKIHLVNYIKHIRMIMKHLVIQSQSSKPKLNESYCYLQNYIFFF